MNRVRKGREAAARRRAIALYSLKERLHNHGYTDFGVAPPHDVKKGYGVFVKYDESTKEGAAKLLRLRTELASLQASTA